MVGTPKGDCAVLQSTQSKHLTELPPSRTQKCRHCGILLGIDFSSLPKNCALQRYPQDSLHPREFEIRL